MPLLLLIFALLAFWPQERPRNLDDFRWKNRIVLYFGQGFDHAWQHDDSLAFELADRKLVYILFSESLKSNQELDFSGDYINSLHKKYAMGAKGPCWVLIGLDGGVKMRKESDLDWPLIFQTIDAMPMRQSERRRGIN